MTEAPVPALLVLAAVAAAGSVLLAVFNQPFACVALLVLAILAAVKSIWLVGHAGPAPRREDDADE